MGLLTSCLGDGLFGFVILVISLFLGLLVCAWLLTFVCYTCSGDVFVASFRVSCLGLFLLVNGCVVVDVLVVLFDLAC